MKHSFSRERVLDTIASLPAGDTRSNVGLGYVDADGAAGRTSARGRQLGEATTGP
jgi:hypothetical protein